MVARGICLTIFVLLGYLNVTPSVVVAQVPSGLNRDMSSKPRNTDKTVTLIFTYAAISCSCPQWVQSNPKITYLPPDKEFVYLEPTDNILPNVNFMWDGESLPFRVSVTGAYTPKKVAPATFQPKGKNEKARIFWYSKLTVICPVSKK